MPRRLANLAAQREPSTDPDALIANGDTSTSLAHWIALVILATTAVTIIGAGWPPVRGPAIGRGPRDGRRRSTSKAKAGTPNRVDPEGPLVPQPGAASPAGRSVSWFLLMAWAAGVLLPLAQLTLNAQEQRGQAMAARAAVQLTRDVAVSLTRTSFETQSRRIAIELSMRADAREIGALYTADTNAQDERNVGRAEAAAANRGTELAGRMARVPMPSDGITIDEIEALASQPADWKKAQALQSAYATNADRFGTTSNLAVVAIAAVLVIEALLQIRAHQPRSSRKRRKDNHR